MWACAHVQSQRELNVLCHTCAPWTPKLPKTPFPELGQLLLGPSVPLELVSPYYTCYLPALSVAVAYKALIFFPLPLRGFFHLVLLWPVRSDMTNFFVDSDTRTMSGLSDMLGELELSASNCQSWFFGIALGALTSGRYWWCHRCSLQSSWAPGHATSIKAAKIM